MTVIPAKVQYICGRHFLVVCYMMYVELTLTADTTWFTSCCTGGLCGATGADYYGDVYSKPQCHRKTSVPGLSL